MKSLQFLFLSKRDCSLKKFLFNMGFVLRVLNILFCSLYHKYEYNERSSFKNCIS